MYLPDRAFYVFPTIYLRDIATLGFILQIEILLLENYLADFMMIS